MLAMLKGGTTSSEVVKTQELEVLAIVIGGGGTKDFHPFIKRGGGAQKVLPCLEWGGGRRLQKVFDLRFSHFVALPPCN